VTAALTRRTRWLLVAGAVALALVVNVAWVAFGPDQGADRGAIESAIQRAWSSRGAPPRAVNCNESRGLWSCEVTSARGDIVNCPVGSSSAFFANPTAALRESCRVQ
jgi:hypothetical protein